MAETKATEARRGNKSLKEKIQSILGLKYEVSIEELLRREHAAVEVSIPCVSCPGVIRMGEDRCSSCGRLVTPADRRAIETRLERSDFAGATMLKKVVQSKAPIVFAGAALFWDTHQIPLAISLSAVMAVMAWWHKDFPLTALSVSLICYVTYLVLSFVSNPSTILEGWLLRMLILMPLVAGLTSLLGLRRRGIPEKAR